MKEQIQTCILPELPIVGTLQLSSRDGLSLCQIVVTKKQKPTELSPFFKKCMKQIEAFLSAKTKTLDLNLDMKGLSSFQLKVLNEMKKIPYGKVLTYRDLAVGIKSKGYQAVGSACGKNPFLLIYPCHRVVGQKDLGGFAHGLPMKKKLLALESYCS